MADTTNNNVATAALLPELQPGEYVFCTFPTIEWEVMALLDPICVFREEEGISLIIAKEIADRIESPYEITFRLISFTADTSLNAVGITAEFSSKLAEKGISANVVAAYHHDHIFVPATQADAAIKILKNL